MAKNPGRVVATIVLACWLPASVLAQTTPAPPQAPDILTLDSAAEQLLRRNLAVEAARLEVGVAEAERVAETGLRLARNRALAEVESAYRGYETAREQVKAYEAGLLDQADESRDITLAAYREGAAELVTLLEAQRTRAEVRTNYFRALYDYNAAIFQLELATGTEIKQ